MISEIIDAIKTFLENVRFWYVINEGTAGVMLRLGKYHKSLTPGFYWKIPFVDEIQDTHCVVTTQELGPQTLVTKDGVSLVIQSIVKHHVTNMKQFMLEVYDSKDAVVDLCEGAVKTVIMSQLWDDIKNNFGDIDGQIADHARADMQNFGVSIDKITITSIAPIRTIRIIQERKAV
jgi:regulator of protease activity HflC (stomatin/prohibitin superfamily)